MKVVIVRGDAERLPLPDQCVDLVFGSPPYVDARLYLEQGQDKGIARNCSDWIQWMLRVTEECLRVCRGAVIWVCSGVTRNRTYQPAPEGLLYEWWKRGGSCYRPCYWHKNGLPGSGGDDWFRADVEYILCFKRAGKLPWANNTAMGHTPKYAPGGEMSHRRRSGQRVNQWRMTSSNKVRRRDGSYEPNIRPSRVWIENDKKNNIKQWHRFSSIRANPGNLIHVPVGGGLIGDKLAHENEAPFPEKLAEFFIKSLCPPNGIVLDPFSGSGTTAKVALQYGRRAIAVDIRQSQCLLTRRRIRTVQLSLSMT